MLTDIKGVKTSFLFDIYPNYKISIGTVGKFITKLRCDLSFFNFSWENYVGIIMQLACIIYGKKIQQRERWEKINVS